MTWHERLQTGFEFRYDGYGRKLAAHELQSLCESLTMIGVIDGQPNISRLLNVGNSAARKEAVGAPEMAPTAFPFPESAPAHDRSQALSTTAG